MTAPTREHEGQRRRLDGEKAQRIISAMRASVGDRGAAASTFDYVAQEAGVSRGLLHYYFGSKERLLIEVVRHDAELRMETLEQRLAGASSVDAIVDGLVRQLEEFLHEDPGSNALVYELFSASRHNDDLQAEMGELYRKWRGKLAEILRAKEREGIVRLRGNAEQVGSIMLALGDGMALQRLSDPSWDSSDAFETGIRTARFLLGEDDA